MCHIDACIGGYCCNRFSYGRMTVVDKIILQMFWGVGEEVGDSGERLEDY